MRTIFIGCVEFSCRVLGSLAASGEGELVGVITKARSSFSADFASIEPLAHEYRVPCFLDVHNDQRAMYLWLNGRAPDVVFCVGWPYLLSPEILSVAPHGVIGYHPAELPHNRGRHPIIWALVLGLDETASTFFRMVVEPDAGPILSKVQVAIKPEDDARTLYDKLMVVAERQAVDVLRGLKSGTLVPIPQDLALGNLWRKRGKPDGLIDWRMNSDSIRNLVRALARPYVGAHCEIRGTEVKVWRVAIAGNAPRNLEPGKVLSIDGQVITVRTGNGALEILEHEFSRLPVAGEYL